MAEEPCFSPSQIDYAIKSLLASRLLSPVQIESEWKPTPFIRLCEEFLIYGVKFVFPPEFGSQVGGIPTAYAAPPLNKIIVAGRNLPPVWPDNKYDYYSLKNSVTSGVGAKLIDMIEVNCFLYMLKQLKLISRFFNMRSIV